MRFSNILASALLVWGCQADESIVTNDALDAITSGALVVDVRTPEEFNEGHFPGAINIPHEQVIQGLRDRNIQPDRTVILYCRSGNRSGTAAAMLLTEGYSRVRNVGGLEAFLAATNTNRVIPLP